MGPYQKGDWIIVTNPKLSSYGKTFVVHGKGALSGAPSIVTTTGCPFYLTSIAPDSSSEMYEVLT